MGIDIRENNKLNKEYARATKDMFDCVAKRFMNSWLHNDFLFKWSTLKKKQDECLKILHNMSNTVLQKRKSEYLNNRNINQDTESTKESKFKPFLDLLLELGMEGTFSDREIREQVDNILFAGHDSMAYTILYTFLLVGSYPNVQKKIFDELFIVFGDDDRDVTKQDLLQLVYLEAVLKESMRIYPIAPVTSRLLDQDIKLRNYTLLKDRSCVLAAYGAHRHPSWGADFEEFKPERWLDPTTIPECPAAFAAFNVGRRTCIGKPYAYMSIKTTLAHVFRRYRMSGDHSKMVLEFNGLLKPVRGHHIEIEARQK